MGSNRRTFLQLSMTAGTAAALGTFPSMAAFGREAAAKPLKILILGGTGFLGPATIDAALARGHTVTAFNRGRTEKRKKEMLGQDVLPESVEKLQGNRDPKKYAVEDDINSAKGLVALEGDREWDAVIDTSGYFPRMVKASAELLAKRVKQYVFISTVSVYKDNSQPHGDETRELATIADPTVEEFGASFENYGPCKALCEQAAEAAMPGRVANVRPGYIVGRGDPTDRFTYWPVRVMRGGEVLVPGNPEDPIQIIDVRDLAEWLIHIVENNITGVYNALGPATPLTMKQVVESAKAASGSDATLTWVPADFLAEQGLPPGSFPIWIPPEDEYAGFHRWNVSKPVAAGLKFRSIEDTCADTIRWWKTLPADRQASFRPGIGVSPEREAELLKLWKGKS